MQLFYHIIIIYERRVTSTPLNEKYTKEYLHYQEQTRDIGSDESHNAPLGF
ncbi:hypothetical protein Hanom_Chr12g01103131 [Helianthus anomalus]